MNKKPYNPNYCTTRENCPGAGSPKHIKHALEEMTVLKLIGSILRCCGDRISPLLSCGCCGYAREIGRRGTMEGLEAHRKAVEARNAYFDKLYHPKPIKDNE